MGLLSFFKRNTETSAAKPVSAGPDDVQQLRLRARRRLMGAAVLVIIGVIGFPLVFETQPRPIPIDLPISIPSKDGAAALVVPAAPAAAVNPAPAAAVNPAPSSALASAETAAKPQAAQGQGIITEDRDGNAVTAPPVRAPDVVASATKKMESVATSVKPAAVEAKPASKPANKPAEKSTPKPNAESARVQALLEGKGAAPSAAANGRVIVQVGAFAESKAAQEVRVKIEHLGLKTYTQAVDTADGRRIRVRVGPFASRDEADKAASKLRGAGLTAAVLTL